ncbi:CHASE3 domain-containing protein [Winogradskyella maritima]|uniref:histidine kinase n=1 Tax=Winogradskyella maritima TaxID=1517766 RepID=A0ABV8AJ60_9FLAO|nr:CHASE3 domain-containing protein [Winogradskyella maritima]
MNRKAFYKSSWFIRTVFFISLGLIFIIGAIAFKNIKNLTDSSDMVVHTYVVDVELEQILSYLKDAETGQRGFLVSKDSVYLDPYNSGREKVNNSFAVLKELTKDNEFQQKNLKVLNTLITKRLQDLKVSTQLGLRNGLDSPVFLQSFLEGKAEMDAIRDKIKEMISYQNLLLKKRQEDYESDLQFTPIFLFLLFILALAIMYLAYKRFMLNIKEMTLVNDQLTIFKESTKQAERISSHGNWIWHVEDDTFEYSDNLYRLLGVEPQSFESTIENFMKHVHPDDVEKLGAEVEKMRENKELPFIYYRIIRADGELRHFKGFGKSIVNSEGEVQLVGTVVDITDEVKNMYQLEERNEELELNNKELSAFNYVASHDLQEPLRKIQTFISRLESKEKDNLSDSGKAYLERMNSASTRMRALIDDLLQYSRTNKADQTFEATDLNSVLEDAQQDLAERIAESQAKIIADELPQLAVVPFQIQQLFANLIGNSIKYAHVDRNPEIKITSDIVSASNHHVLKESRANRYAKITFQDNGIGFDNEYAEKIFVLFHRLHNREDYSGTGIGLSICKKIVDNHHGFITAEGQKGVGATFTIFLPTAQIS